MKMKMTLRDALVGGATVALLLYAAVTAARNMANALDQPAQRRVTAACVATAGHACPASLQVARGRD